jgi:hypothetical protein
LQYCSKFHAILSVYKCAIQFGETNKWLNENTADLGNLAVLYIYKNGKIVYSNTANGLSRKQKIIAKKRARTKLKY